MQSPLANKIDFLLKKQVIHPTVKYMWTKLNKELLSPKTAVDNSSYKK